MIRIICLYFVIVLLLGLPLGNFAQTRDITPIPLNPKVIRHVLDNGFTYYIQPNAIPAKQIQMRMVIKAGSILETEEQQGFAHFLEHMVFNGSKNFPDNSLIDYLQSIGVEFGSDLNAYTGYDETVYMLPLPNGEKETLDKAFLFFSDLLSDLTLSTQDIDNERNIILEEWRTTIGLDQRLKEQMYPLLYSDSRYLRRLPIGQMDVVTKKGNDEELRKFWRSWYRPDLATLIVVGDFDQTEIDQRIKDTFDSKKVAADAPLRPSYSVPVHEGTLVKIIKDKEITSSSVKIINKFPHHPEQTLGDLKRSVINLIYTYMVNQRLTEISQRHDAPFMYAQSFASAASGGTDRYMSLAAVKEDHIIDGAKGLMRELMRIKQHGFSQAELNRKKEILFKDVIRSAEEDEKLSSAQIMEGISNHVIYGEENAGITFKNEFVQQVLSEITLADIQNLVGEYMDPKADGRVVLVTTPEDAATPAEVELLAALNEVISEELDPYEDTEVSEPLMAQRPIDGSVVKESYSKKMDITTIEFANGVSVSLKPTDFQNDEIRFSSMRMGGYSLASLSDFDNASLSDIVVSQGGLAQFSSLQMDRILSGKQVYLAPYIHRYDEGVTGFSSKADFETLLQLTHLTYTSPRKDYAKFEQFIENKKEYNRNSLNNPDSYFTDEINKVMMQNSPWTATLLTPEKLDSISLDKAFDFYRSRFQSASGTRFFIVGSFDVDSIKPLLIKYLGGLPGGEIRSSYVDNGVRPPRGDLRFDYPRNMVEKTKVLMRYTGRYPGSQQARIEMGLLSDILTIRLNQKLREEIGGVYSPFASSTILQHPYSSYRMDIYFTCSPANVDTLIEATLGEIEQMKNQISIEDLDKVKRAWLKNRDGSLKTNGYWRRVLEDQWTRGEDENDFEKYENQILDVSAKQLSRLAKKCLDKQNHFEFILSPKK